MVGWIGNQIGSFADGVVSGLKDFFGIQSPSKLMRDLIGENIAAGIGEGIAQNENLVLNPLDDLQRKMSNVNLSSNLSGSVNKMLDYDNSITITVPINANLDGKPIYQNVVTRVTKVQGLRTQFKGGFKMFYFLLDGEPSYSHKIVASYSSWIYRRQNIDILNMKLQELMAAILNLKERMRTLK